MSPKQLDVFITVVRLGSVTAAAQVLNISQPSVSKSLSLIEQQVGFTLFERVSGRMQPTAEAREVYEEACRVQQGMERFSRLVEHVRRYSSGQLRVCATPALALDVLHRVAKPFRARFPGYGLALDMCRNDEIEEAVAHRQYDLGFIVQPESSVAADDLIVCRGAIVCVLPRGHALARQQQIAWDDLQPHELIYITTDPRIIAMMNKTIPRFHERPVSALETNRYSIAVNLVRQGLGATLVDQFAVAGEDRSALVVRPFLPFMPMVVRAVVGERTVVREQAQAFIDELRRVLEACP